MSAKAPVLLDVRADIAAGREPFSKIMAAAREVGPGGELVILAPFEPEPLYPVLGRMGFSYATLYEGEAGYRVVFTRRSS
jgi:hypothetical protein